MGFVDKDGAEKKDKSNQETTGEKAQRKLQEQKELCKKWMNEMVRLIGELTLQINKYNKEKDDREGYWSHKKQGRTEPGGHRRQIESLSNGIRNLNKKIKRCKEFEPDRVKQLQEEAQKVLERANQLLQQANAVPMPSPQPSCSNSPALEEAGKGAAAVGAGVVLYWIISEALRILFPPRNLVPVP